MTTARQEDCEQCAGAALLDGPKLLLIRVRSAGYELPKGHIEPGETPEQAALRELREETGIVSAVMVEELLGRVAYAYPSQQGVLHKEVQFYRCRVGETPRFGLLPPRTRELRWIEAEEVASVRLVSENLRPILQRAFGLTS
ncbi:MAG: NUDIX domain-containing protein [Gemmataceae bacterium]